MASSVAAPEPDSVEHLLRRVDAMLERAEVFSEPALPSCTDRMLDLLLARSKRPPPPAPSGRAPSGSSRPSDAAGRGANWLDLPSLQELMDARRALLAQRVGGCPRVERGSPR